MLAVQEEDEKQSSSAQSADPLMVNCDERVVACIRKVLIEHPSEELLKVFTQSFLNHIQESVNLKGVRFSQVRCVRIDYQYKNGAWESIWKSFYSSEALLVFWIPWLRLHHSGKRNQFIYCYFRYPWYFLYGTKVHNSLLNSRNWKVSLMKAGNI